MSPDETNFDISKIQEMINVFNNIQKYEKKIIYRMKGAIDLMFGILLLTAGAVDFVISYFIYWPNILTFVFWMMISSIGWFITHIFTKNFRSYTAYYHYILLITIMRFLRWLLKC